VQRWHGLWPELVSGAAALERWALPGECLLCEEGAGPRDPLICDRCRRRWRPVVGPWCDRCGQPKPDALPCRLCAEWPAALRRARSGVWLDDGARRAVHALKYSGRWRVTAQFAEVMRGLEPLAERVILVPVPLAPKRLRIRGYNQAERLAAALAERTGLPLAEALDRKRETPTQTALTPEMRRANVAGAFAGMGVAGKRVVLVDDVLTTGATLGACAEALVAAGAERVEAVTFARARAVGDFV
jgi:ComF family protein